VTPHELRFTREAQKDFRKLSPKLREKLRRILTEVVAVTPRDGKRLTGDLTGFYSLRLTYQDRIVYSIEDAERRVVVHRCRTHYGD
jgi:mRNA-degrading endonuclease RelE of RelBE toxin-antitoxin system